MAFEAVLIHELEPAIPFTVADGTGIEKGALLKMSDPMTVALTTAASDIFAGVLKEEKIASDGITKGSVYMDGIFKVYLSGACAVGDSLRLAENNYVAKVTAIQSGIKCCGYALETGTTGEQIFARLFPGTVGAL